MRMLLVAALLLPTAAAARPTLALRAGWAPSLGDASADVPMDEIARSQIPIQVDALWRFTPRFAAGLYFSYGFGLLDGDVSDRCDALGADCSVSTVRLGAQGTYTFPQWSQKARAMPWLGAGVGYEWVNLSAKGPTFSASQRVSGWELLNVQAGTDFAVGSRFGWGPYAMFSIGRYSSVDGNNVADKASHEWLHLGIRGKFDI